MLSRALPIGDGIMGRVAKRINTFGRTVAQKGNGQRRVIISGFTGQNLNPAEHFSYIDKMNSLNLRPIIRGFSNSDIYAQRMSGTPLRGFVKFMPRKQNPKMKRHIVYDVEPPRIVVKGFSDSSTAIKITGHPLSPATKLPAPKDLIAQKRVVVQGFVTNSAEPVYKDIDLTPKTRTVVKGFCC